MVTTYSRSLIASSKAMILGGALGGLFGNPFLSGSMKNTEAIAKWCVTHSVLLACG